MDNQPQVMIDDALLDEFTFISTVFSPVDENLGILIMGEDFNPLSNYVVIRFYLLKREYDDVFHIQTELQALSFASFNDSNIFLPHLPQMSALELILSMGAMNSIH